MTLQSVIAAPKTTEQLEAALPHILAAPKDAGRLDLIVTRPERNMRETPDTARVSAAEGVPGDHWLQGTGFALEDGSGDPDAQICIMMSRSIGAIAGQIENWAPAGDNFFIDMDLTPDNMPPGTRFAIGSAEFIVTETVHAGCQKFIDRYGRDACVWVNTPKGRSLCLRGIYARVTQDGTVTRGDVVRKLS